MQSAAPQAVDLSSESEATKKLYGMHEEITEKFGATAYRQNDRRSVDGSNGSRSSGSDSRSLRREFGRTSFNEKGKGRDYNPWGFTMWFAGGGRV